jgi:hypothetical protein
LAALLVDVKVVLMVVLMVALLVGKRVVLKAGKWAV